MEQNGKLEYGNGTLMHIVLHRIYNISGDWWWKEKDGRMECIRDSLDILPLSCHRVL